MKWRNFRQSKPVGGGAELHSPPQRTTAEAPGCPEATSPCLANNGSPPHLNPSIPSNGDHLKCEVPEDNGASTPGSALERRPTGEKVDSSSPEANRLLSAWIPASSSGPDPNHFHLAKEQLCTRALWG
ncbi:unnamed protein product [Dibothriocephalus latus]|uniref:Uncharacterized protein n=1 Tax=Dibothriocephalus latus TaxID=60516 RepID=A0A3P7NJ26_DIBLA|nr:unnamed protein product [Dibothriocephalus latus]